MCDQFAQRTCPPKVTSVCLRSCVGCAMALLGKARVLGRESGPTSELFPVFSESAPLFFPSPSTHLSIDKAREAIRFVPWEQSMSEESRGKKAREAGRNAVKERERVWSPGTEIGGNTEISRFDCRRGGDLPAELKGTCCDTTDPTFLLQNI